MLYKMSLSVNEIPPLFVQLDQLELQDDSEHLIWREKARWIRFEEHAEDVPGRWSKPHVATLPQTAIDELKDMLANGKLLFDVLLTDMKEIADVIANELLDYFQDLESARHFAEIMCLVHHHHHEKVKKVSSGSNLVKMASSANFQEMSLIKRDSDAALTTTDKNQDGNNSNSQIISNLLNNPSSKNLSSSGLKYQYSFTDSILLDEFSSQADFKENTKFKKKVHRKAEGASIFVMPVDFVKSSKIVFLRLEAATEFQGLFEVNLRARFLVVVIGPTEKHNQLYEVGRAISTCLADDVCRELFYSAKSKEDILSVINHFNRGTMVIPPGEWNPKIRIEPPEKYMSKEERKKVPELSEYIHVDESELKAHDHADPTLKGSKKLFGGILKDIKRKLPFYVSDFTDSLNLQCIATTLYMYLVCLCSLVAFGGMLGKKTNDQMATMECILAGSICGILFSLFSGQPLNIISATGPMLILETIINNLCIQYGVDFMEFRLWVGIWTGLFILILVAFNLSYLVKYITRFTEDCFATLVAIIFVIDAIKSTFNLRKMKIIAPLTNASINNTFSNAKIDELNLNESSLSFDTNGESFMSTTSIEYKLLKANKDAYFFFSVLLFITTFVICMGLKSFRNKPFLPSKIREIFSDFAVMIAILIASGIDNYMGLGTEKLTIPSEFKPTSERGWFIPFISKNKFWHAMIAAVPALIATILVVMDQQITAVIVNRKEFKLKKSSGYHLDLFIIGITIVICSMLGLPWFVAATVLALTHVNSLKMMSENTAPGERPVFMGVREQRVTTLLMSILVGLSVFLAKVLSFIPMAVLYGVFLFMGVSALRGMQLVERILILFMPAKHQPDTPYLRHVNTRRVHLFTIIQIISTSGLYLIKFIESVAITFPILVLATCGIRKLLDFVFSQRELFWLDDLLPGSTIHNTKKAAFGDPEKQNREKECMIKSNDINLSSSTNSNSYLDTDHDMHELNPNMKYIDMSDENNNTRNEANHHVNHSNSHQHATKPANLTDNHISNHRSHSHSQVKFVTHFPNIAEDET